MDTEWPTALNGLWWVPERPEERVAGTLTIEGRRLVLRLIGHFQTLSEFGKPHQPGVIVGATREGKHVTLVQPSATEWKITAPGVPSATYRAAFAILGHLFESLGQVVFDTLNLGYPLLMEWAGRSGFSLEHTLNEQKHVEAVAIHYRFPEPVEAEVPGAKVRLEYEATQDGDMRNRLALAQSTSVQIVPSEPLEPERFWSEWVYHIQNYLTFATDAVMRPRWITATSPHALGRERDGEAPRKPLLIWNYVLLDAVDVHARDEMLFRLPDLDGGLGPTLTTWVQRAEQIGPVYDLYFGIRYKPDAYLNSQLLGIAQALEVYHRRVCPGVLIDTDAFSSMRRGLVDSLPSGLEQDVRSLVVSRLAFLNEFSLRQRLVELGDLASPAVDMLIPDRDQFVGRMTATRNFLTHYNPDLEEKAATGEDLYWLVQQAQALLEIHLLLALGLSMERVASVVRRNQRYLGLARAMAGEA